MGKAKSVVAKSGTLAAISSSAVYPQSVFQQLQGIGRHAFAQLRRRGLRTAKIGNKIFVRGADWDAFLAQPQQAAESKGQ